jgi:single-strand DNA-binding protein
MSVPRIALSGRLVEDPTLKFTQQGKAVCRLRLVAADRKKDGDKWVDGDTLWISATCWDRLAENVAESTKKGDLVIVTGRLVTEEWNDREGNKRSAITLKVDAVAADLSFRIIQHANKQHEQVDERQPEGEDPWATPLSPTVTPAGEQPAF